MLYILQEFGARRKSWRLHTRKCSGTFPKGILYTLCITNFGGKLLPVTCCTKFNLNFMGHAAGENFADIPCYLTQEHVREFQIKAFMGEKGFEILPRKPLFSLGPEEDL